MDPISGKLDVEFIHPFRPEGVQRIRDGADALRSRCEGGNDNLLTAPEFVIAAEKFCRCTKTRKIRYALVKKGGDLVAMFPVEIGPEKHLPGTYFSLLQHPTRLSGAGVLCPPSEMAEALRGLLRALRSEWPRACGFVFSGIDEDSQLYSELSEALSIGYRLSRGSRRQLYLDLTEFPTIEAYYDSRSRHYKKNFRTGRNRLNKMGGYEFSGTGPAGEWQFQDMADIDAKTWRADDKEGEIPAILLELCKDMSTIPGAKAGNRLRALTFEGKPISMYFSLIYGGVKYVFKNTFDPAFANVSPSVVAFHHVVEEAVSDGVSRIELMAGNEYARPWANRERFLSEDVVFFRSVTGRAAYAAARGARLLRDLIRKRGADMGKADADAGAMRRPRSPVECVA